MAKSLLVVVGIISEQTITISNAGDSDLVVDGFGIEGTHANIFQVISPITNGIVPASLNIEASQANKATVFTR